MATLFLVVSVVFIQRHFDGVTRQMTSTVVDEVNLLLKRLDHSDSTLTAEFINLAAGLGYRITSIPQEDMAAGNLRRWYDFSGRVITATILDGVPAVTAVRLPSDFEAEFVIITGNSTGLLFALDRDRLSASNPHQLLVNMVFFGILVTGIAYLYLRNQLRPISRLADAASAFGLGVHLPYRPGGAEEVRAAGHAFLEMRDRIESQIEQRMRMLSGISHDLRTPLTRLRLSVSMLDNVDTREIEGDLTEMEHMLDAFLGYARIWSEVEEVKKVDLHAIAKVAVLAARRSGGNVRFADGGEVCAGAAAEDARAGRHRPVAMRPSAVRRALDNLVGNAVRHAGKVEVAVRRGPGEVALIVEDDGPGIPEDRRELAMRPFVRLDPARNQDRGGGVGLGLAIAADIARSHGGNLRLAHSRRLGGLKATIAFPA